MAKFKAAATVQATIKEMSSTSQPGIPGTCSCNKPTTVQLVSAPTINTSPWAKLIRLMMP